ncbi:MAG: flavin reductase family protein [Burkholderiaceae bacterium]
MNARADAAIAAGARAFVAAPDQRALRDALGLFATGVAVVACAGEAAEPVAITVSSFNSVSLDPPLVLFSLHNAAASMPVWLRARHYTISVLSAGQRELSGRFAKALSDKWKDLTPAVGPLTGAPMLPEALACFECQAHAHHPGGDHTIFVGKVLSLHAQPASDSLPLLFFGGRYRGLAEEGRGALADGSGGAVAGSGAAAAGSDTMADGGPWPYAW